MTRVARDAFVHLARDAQERGRHRQWCRPSNVRSLLRSHHLSLLDDPRYLRDIERLRVASSRSIDSQRSELTIQAPDGMVSIERNAAHVVRDVDGAVALTGGAGVGKSAAAVRLATDLLKLDRDVVFLTADCFATEVAAVLGLTFDTSLTETLLSWDGCDEATLIVDGIDSTRGTSHGDWLRNLLPHLEGTRWRTVATLRTHDLRSSREWRRSFRGEPPDAGSAVPDLSTVRHLLVGDLDDAELDQVKSQSTALASLIDSADPQMLELLRNPFNLNLAADLLSTGDLEGPSARTRLDLLDAYWKARIRVAGASGSNRRAAIRQLTEAMLESRRSTVDIGSAVEPANQSAVAALIHAGTLREISAQYSDAQFVEFAHPLFFDYSVSASVFSASDGPDLVSRLDRDRNLVIRLWPSVELYLSALWAQDDTRVRFWDIAMRFATRPDGHPLAGIACAFVALRARPATQDFAPIFDALRSERRPEAIRCLNHLSGSLNCEDIPKDDRLDAIVPLSDAAAVTAEIARAQNDLEMADTTRVLLRRIDQVSPLDVGVAGAHARARSAASLMQFALADPTAPRRIDVVAHGLVLLGHLGSRRL